MKIKSILFAIALLASSRALAGTAESFRTLACGKALNAGLLQVTRSNQADLVGMTFKLENFTNLWQGHTVCIFGNFIVPTSGNGILTPLDENSILDVSERN